MSDQSTTSVPTSPSRTIASPPSVDDLALSEHAEDVLAQAVGHELELINDGTSAPLKTVKQVLTEMVDDRDELAITLEYGTGESGVDQASWDIEVTRLQRAFQRRQKSKQIAQLAQQLEDAVRNTKTHVGGDWFTQTLEIRNLMKDLQQDQIQYELVNNYQKRIFGRETYLSYIEAVLAGTDQLKLLNAAANLSQIAKQLEADYQALIDPALIDNSALADAIIATDGDIDKLSHEIERDYSFAVFRRSIAAADAFYQTISIEFLKQYKLWAHSFDLNLREVLATEHNTHAPITDKAREQLRDMLAAGAEQVNAIVRVLV